MTAWIDLVGYLASAAVLAAFCVREMVPLRCLAIMSNVLFMAYGFFAHLQPVLLLHAVLLPINVVRLVQVRRPRLMREFVVICRTGLRWQRALER